MDRQEIIKFLDAEGKEQEELHVHAAQIRDKTVGKEVYFRGLIEFSNCCENDCLYCGIRRSNTKVEKYSMTKEEILGCVGWCDKVGYGSVVLQSGEMRTKKFVDFVTDIVSTIKSRYPNIAITLSVGEQTKETYKKFFDAGAERYLLRIETSNKELYKKLHPDGMSFENRIRCLKDLKAIGYQLGTGVMIGLPYQTVEHLADDLLFFKEIDADMVGMGPYLPHFDTPLGNEFSNIDKKRNQRLALNMIATLRLLMPDINIASTTALQAISHNGRELGLKAGANVIMPLVTPKDYRASYKLYEDKPCINESSDECLRCIVSRIRSTGLEPGFNMTGTSMHFKKHRGG